MDYILFTDIVNKSELKKVSKYNDEKKVKEMVTLVLKNSNTLRKILTL